MAIKTKVRWFAWLLLILLGACQKPTDSAPLPEIVPLDGKQSLDQPSTAFRLGGGYAEDPGREVVFGYKKTFDFGRPYRDIEKEKIYGSYRRLSFVGHPFFDHKRSIEDPEPVILQAFNMPYHAIIAEIPYLSEAGYTHIQISPPQKSLNNFGVWWELYQPLDFSVLSNRLGNAQQLRSLIEATHEHGLRLIVDVVLNHMADPARRSKEASLYYPKSEGNGAGFLFEPKHFHYGEIYADHQAFMTHMSDLAEELGLSLRNPVTGALTEEFQSLLHEEERAYYYNKGRVLYDGFMAFLVRNQLSLEDGFEGSIEEKAYEILFLKSRLPVVYQSFLAYLQRFESAHKEEILRYLSGLERDEFFGSHISDAARFSFHNAYQGFFGKGALIVQGHYYSVRHEGEGPLYQNEWDDLSLVWHKWYPGLPSLKKGVDKSPEDRHVLEVHAHFLASLIRLGVDGFRFDAIKHIPFSYTQSLIKRVSDLLKLELETQIDGEILLDKEFLIYGEIATSRIEIAQSYQKQMAVTDFFLLDTMIKHFCRPYQRTCPTQSDLRQLRKTNLLINSQSQMGWSHSMLVPKNPKPTTFRLGGSIDFRNPSEKTPEDLRTTIAFARIHDSVVGFMYKIPDYTGAMLAQAYVLATTSGIPLVYGSDFDLERNAGADYKEEITLQGILFRNLVKNAPYLDAYPPTAYCEGCDRKDLLLIDRSDSGLAIINKAAQDVILRDFRMINLKPGCYRELMSGQKFRINQLHEPVVNGEVVKETHLQKNTPAFIVEALECPEY